MSIFSLFAIYSKSYSTDKMNEYYDDDLKTYTVILNEQDISDDYSGKFESILNDLKDVEEITAVLNKPYCTYAYYLFPEKQSAFSYYGLYFNEKDFFSDKKDVVIGIYTRMSGEEASASDFALQVGTECLIAGDNYTVIGSANNVWDEISYYSLSKEQNKAIETILVTLNDIPTEKENEQITALLAQLFPASSISQPEKQDNNFEGRMWETVASVSICVLSVIILSYLIGYILEMRKKGISISLIVGIKKSRLVWSIFLENIIISTCLYMACSVLFHFVFSKIMVRLEIITFEIGAAQYLYLYGVYLACIILILGLRILLSVNRSAKELYRGCS